MSVIEIENLVKHYGRIEALKGVTLNVQRGEIFGLLGPNGAGKTTLFNLICGIHAPDGGEIWLRDRPLSGLPVYRRARLGTGHPGDKELVHGHVLSDFHKADLKWVEPLITAVADAAPLLAAGEDEKYQTEVMRLAPAEKADPRKLAQGRPSGE